jgi:hypothetical protein
MEYVFRGQGHNLAMLFTFRAIGFGWDGHGFLITSSIQSPKLIAVWTSLEPLPMIVANPAPIIGGIVLFGILHAFHLPLAESRLAGRHRAARTAFRRPAFLHDVSVLGVFHPVQPVRRTPGPGRH